MANQALASMTAASALTGSEILYGNQSGGDVKITTTQIQTFVGSGITIGTTAITGGTTTRILYDNAGVVGEYTLSGSGTAVAMATSPSFTTPTLGVASATSINKVTITAPASGSTLTIADGKTVTHNATTTFAGTDGKTLTISNTLTLTATDGSTLAIGTGGTLGTAAYQNTGTTGATLPFLNGINTWGAAQTIGSNALTFNGSSLIADASNILALRNSTTAQSLLVYATFTDASNYGRLTFNFSGNTAQIRAEQAGTGGVANLNVFTGSGGQLNLGDVGVGVRWRIDQNGMLLAVSDNSYDIGASGATRPRSIYVGTNLTVGAIATLAAGTATPAGGSTSARLLFGTTSGFGIYYGSGAPTVSAALGSFYMRSDGSSTITRAYINTDGSTTWTPLTTVG